MLIQHTLVQAICMKPVSAIVPVAGLGSDVRVCLTGSPLVVVVTRQLDALFGSTWPSIRRA